MQTRFLQSVVAVAVVVGAGVVAQAQTMRLRADVPFEFIVGSARIPAGECTLTSGSNPGLIQVRSVASGEMAIFVAIVDSAARTDEAPSLRFNRYGDSYYLSSVATGAQQTRFDIPPSKVEKELSRSARNRTEVTVLAKR